MRQTESLASLIPSAHHALLTDSADHPGRERRRDVENGPLSPAVLAARRVAATGLVIAFTTASLLAADSPSGRGRSIRAPPHHVRLVRRTSRMARDPHARGSERLRRRSRSSPCAIKIACSLMSLGLILLFGLIAGDLLFVSIRDSDNGPRLAHTAGHHPPGSGTSATRRGFHLRPRLRPALALISVAIFLLVGAPALINYSSGIWQREGERAGSTPQSEETSSYD